MDCGHNRITMIRCQGRIGIGSDHLCSSALSERWGGLLKILPWGQQRPLVGSLNPNLRMDREILDSGVLSSDPYVSSVGNYEGGGTLGQRLQEEFPSGKVTSSSIRSEKWVRPGLNSGLIG
ncbi:hypothetical protein R1flu_022602 [Riccia fluitans]|uniref:Uncharacterized protein n=1 Tax=Riccia fluitans TaxID=41844 RepID=A0ABD1XPN3_9MARC